MNYIIRQGVLRALTCTLLLAGAPVMASTVFETATAVPGGSGDYPIYGDGTDAGSNFFGTSFSLTGPGVTSLQVGANVDAYGGGQVFAEIVSAASAGSVPSVTGGNLVSWLQSHSLGEALLTAPAAAGDASTVINFASTLAAGSYAVIFGTGLYGATGAVNLTSGNTTVGAPTVFGSFGGSDFQAAPTDADARIFVQTSPVPLPAGLPLLASGMLAGFGFMRRRRGARTAA